MTTDIIEEIIQHISYKGGITFREFMETALYHSQFGYYTSSRMRIGKEGDYYTSSDVHAAFGVCVMRQIDEMAALLGSIDPLKIVEIGAGKGLLCLDILRSARDKAPSLFEKMNYFIVEKSPDFRERQKKLLAEAGLAEKVSWVSTIGDALNDGIGIVLSNELVDAFPVHRVIYRESGWKEIYLTLNDEALVETEGEISDSRISDILAGVDETIDEGYTTEVNLDAVDWIKGVGAVLKKGFVITIDYGYPRRDLYAPERNRGTLICYHRHQAVEDPYINIGEQDITTHVDFTTLAEAGTTVGLEVTGFTDQSYFLMGCGIEEEFTAVERLDGKGLSGYMNNITLKKLLMPGGMGGTFKVLIQHKGLEGPRLRGFSFRDNSRRLF